jgi:hypothetical protein
MCVLDECVLDECDADVLFFLGLLTMFVFMNLRNFGDSGIRLDRLDVDALSRFLFGSWAPQRCRF